MENHIFLHIKPLECTETILAAELELQFYMLFKEDQL
jgi:hypothetical protein